MTMERHSAGAERRRDALAAAPRVGGDIGAEVELLGAGFLGQPGELSLGRAVAEDQSASARPQRRVEVGQALEQELGSRS